MKKNLFKKMCICGIILLCIGASAASSKREKNVTTQVELSNLLIGENVLLQQTQTTTNGRTETISIVAQEPLSPQDTTPLVPPLNTRAEERTPRIADVQRTFSIRFGYQTFIDSLVLSLREFSWDPDAQSYCYTLQESYEFSYKDRLLGTLTELTVEFKISIPYEISYSYRIVANPFQAPYGEFMNCDVRCSPLLIESGFYKGRIQTSEYCYESWDDYDGTVIKIAHDFTGDPHDSMVYFMTSNGVFQRGFLYLMAIIGDGKTPTGGAWISVSFRYPTPPDYFNIAGGEIDRFWIESSWDGTIGDIYSSSQRFTVAPQ